jgi:hypothetical protein
MVAVTPRPLLGGLGGIATFVACLFAGVGPAAGQDLPPAPESWPPPAVRDSLLSASDSLRVAAGQGSWTDLLLALGAVALLVLLFHKRSS